MITTLAITVTLESIVVTVYCVWRRQPLRPILLTSLCGNLLTQSFLWMVLRLFFPYYLITLCIAELLIWIVEGILLSVIPANQLGLKQALLLSLAMNLVSFSAGLLLPV